MKTIIDLRGADLAIWTYWNPDGEYIYLKLDDCEGGELGLRLDKSAAELIIERLQEALAKELNP